MIRNIRPEQYRTIPWGWKNKVSEGVNYGIVEHPGIVKEIDLVKYFMWNTYSTQPSVLNTVLSKAEDVFATADMKCVYTTLWRFLGNEVFVKIHNGTIGGDAERVFRMLYNWNRMWLDNCPKKIDYFLIGDDVAYSRGMLFSPLWWGEVFKPLYSRMIEMVKRYDSNIKIVFHSDGDITEILPYLATMELDGGILFERVGRMNTFKHGDAYMGIQMLDLKPFPYGFNPGYIPEVEDGTNNT